MNTDLLSKLNDLVARIATVEERVVEVQWQNMRKTLIFTKLTDSESGMTISGGKNMKSVRQ